MAEIQIPKRTKKEKEALISQVIEMMAIPGKSGEEQQIAEYIRNQLVDAGADPKAIRTDTSHRKTRIKGEVGNLVFKLPGTYKAPRRMLSAHMDTVPICEGCRPKRVGMRVTSMDKHTCLLYTSPSPRDLSTSRMPSSA